ncbi:MAG: ABC transporter permease, partial [Caldilinea sp.]
MYELKLAWRNLASRPVQTLVTLTVVALAVALAVTVIHLNEGLQRGIIRASDPFGMLVVGAKGSPLQLILATVFQIDAPTGNIPLEEAEFIRRHPLVASAIP